MGIAVPWAIAMIYRWFVSRTQISNRALRFDGKGGHIFGVWLLLLVLIPATVLLVLGATKFGYGTCGHGHGGDCSMYKIVLSVLAALAVLAVIFVGMWVNMKVVRSLLAHTHFTDSKGGAVSTFTAGYWAFFGKSIVFMLRFLITLGLGASWAYAYYGSWLTSKVQIDGASLQYDTGTSFLKQWWAPYWLVSILLQTAQNLLSSYAEERHTHDFSGIVCLVFLFVNPWIYNFINRQIVMRVSIADAGVVGA